MPNSAYKKATPRLWQVTKLPRAILPALQKRLQMFVLRSKVKLENFSATVPHFAAWGGPLPQGAFALGALCMLWTPVQAQTAPTLPTGGQVVRDQERREADLRLLHARNGLDAEHAGVGEQPVRVRDGADAGEVDRGLGDDLGDDGVRERLLRVLDRDLDQIDPQIDRRRRLQRGDLAADHPADDLIGAGLVAGRVLALGDPGPRDPFLEVLAEVLA